MLFRQTESSYADAMLARCGSEPGPNRKLQRRQRDFELRLDDLELFILHVQLRVRIDNIAQQIVVDRVQGRIE